MESAKTVTILSACWKIAIVVMIIVGIRAVVITHGYKTGKYMISA